MKRDKTGKFIPTWNGELKQAVKLSLTQTAWQELEQQAKAFGISRSELVERYARHSQCGCCTAKVELQQQVAQLQQTVEELRSQQQQAQTQTNERQWLEAVLDLLPTPLILVDPQQKRVTFSNRAANAIAGVDIAKDIGATYNENYYCTDAAGQIIPPEQVPAVRAAQGEKITGVEINWHTPVGVFPLLVYADTLPAMHDHATTSVVLFQDIREHKQTEERLQLALSSANMVAWDVDLQTNYVVCSPNALEIWGLQAGTAEDFFSTVHPDDQPCLIQALEQAKAGEEHYLQEYRVVGPDGTIHWLKSQGRVYFDRQGQAVRVTGVSINISDRKQAEIVAVRSSDRTARLQKVTAALAEALTPVDVATVVVDQALAALGACRGLVSLLKPDGAELELIRSVGYAPNTLSQWHCFPITANIPLAEVVRTQTPIFLQSLNEMVALYPPLSPLQESIPLGAIAAIPLIAENQVLGSLAIAFTEAHSIQADDREFILALARQCAQAIRRAQLYAAEQAARANAEASEQRFRFMAESIPQIVWVAQANGFTEYYNQRWFQYTGLTLEESQNAKGSFRHPEDHDHFKDAWIKALTHKETFQAEQRIRRADGVYRWHLTRAYPLLDKNGEIVKWFGSCTDIDDWKRMEQTQRFLAQASRTFAAANLNLQTVLDTLTQLTSDFTGDVCLLNLLSEDKQWLNPASCYHADLAIREFASELLSRFARRADEGMGGRVIQTGEPILMAVSSQAELSAAIKPEYRPYLERYPISSVLLVPLKVQGEVTGVLMLARHTPATPHTQDDLNLFQDLADRAAMAIANARLYQQAEQARQRAEETADRTIRLQSITAILSEQLTPAEVAAVIVEQSQAVLNAAAALVAVVCEHGSELEIIQAVGYQQDLVEQWRRFPISIASPMTDAIQTGEIIWESSLEERATRYPHIAKAYARYEFRAWMSLPLMVEGRAVGGITLSFKESTKLREEDRAFFLALTQQCAQAIARAQLYAAEQRARSQAEAANRIKDEFLAVLSHELRTPMNPILGWAQLLKQGKLDAAKTAVAIETIERNARLQVELIEDLLDISRILQGKLSLNSQPVDLSTTVNAAIETVCLAAAAKNIEIYRNFEAQMGQVLGDAARLQQVVWNLLSNAVKFTPEQGQIEIQLATVGAHAQIQVKDTGKGIEPKFLPYVFDYFRQADSSITRTFGGLGLGLAIARHIVELHGGTISAESAGSGQGATFTVTLPLHQHEQTESNQLSASTQHSGPSAPLAGIQVLVVDDELDNLELATFILESAGATVVAVSSAPAALQSLAHTQPDVLLTDIGMPEMDGYTLLQQIRALPTKTAGHIPAIALTAYAGEINQQQALAVGFEKHLAKPIDPNALVTAVAELSGRT